MWLRFSTLTIAGAAVIVAAGWSLLAEAVDQQAAPQTVVATPAGGRQEAPAGGRGRGVSAAPAADHPANADADLSPKPPVVALSPAEEARRFWLPPGYRMEPVLADPDIEAPGQVAFDGNGRMFVAELRGYVQTLDGIDAIAPVGRISVHEDRDNDGVYEHHTTFVDQLLFPRFVLPLGADSVLTMETNADEVWKYTDTNGDGTADKKELFTANFGRAGNVEAQQASLYWAMDNWLYSSVNAFRLRLTPNGLLKEPTGPNGAQWGVSQDNDGKVWFQSGASGMPGYFQFPVHYGNFTPPDQFEPDLSIMWGAPILVGDIQAGLPGTRLPDGSLIRGTAAAGNEIFRGDRLPADLIGDYLYGETVGRIVRRLKAVKTDGLTQLQNAYPRSEFVRSLDPLFRPVDVATAPDGTLYIADLYRGIIEGAEWAKEGTYLRRKIDQYQLDKVLLGHGRIFRLAYDGMPRDRTRPRMLNETAAQLVTHLTHPNGWWRDTAQQLLVLKQDRSVVPSLQRIVRTSGNLLGRFHALWTLEGLGALDSALVRAAMEDPSPRMRIQAIRASETLYKTGDKSFAADYRGLTSDPDTDVVIQAMLTLNVLKVPDAAATLQSAMRRHATRGVQFVGDRILNPPPAAGRGGAVLSAEQQAGLDRGAAIYTELCFACHGDNGRGTPTPGAGPGSPTLAPSLAGSPRVNGHRDYVVKAVTHGLSGPIDGTSYPQVMAAMGTNTDQWIADIATYVRNGFGNSASWVTAADVARVRAASGIRTGPWTVAELDASLPRPLIPDASWKATASHNPSGAGAGLDFRGWTTGAPQQPGMWFQIELPKPLVLTELQFDSRPVGGRAGSPPTATFPRGYRVELSADGGGTWSAPVAEGRGSGRTTTVTFAPVRANAIRITQTDAVENAPIWSVERLRLYEAPRTVAGGFR